MTTLRLNQVQAGYSRGAQVLHGVSMTAESGKITTIIGANGAGKSTALRCVSNLVRLSGGEITLGDLVLNTMAVPKVVAAGVGHVPEGRRLFGAQSVLANLQLGGYPFKLGKAELEKRVRRAVEVFPVLRDRLHEPASALSGGQQQMLAIAQALIAEPRVLLLDEPSLGLAPKIVDEVFAVLERLRADGVAVVLVEQLVERALELADYAYVMQNGRIVGEGDSDMLKGSDVVRKAYLGAAAGHTK